MNKQDKLNAIEKLWKSKKRHDEYWSDAPWELLPWETIQWEPFAVKGRSFNNFEFPEVPRQLDDIGHFMYVWGVREVASGTVEWDRVLLRGLYTWYNLPDNCAAPLFVNEAAGAICIPDIWWADSLALLFQHPDSVRIGMDNLEAEKAAQEAGDEAKYEAEALANAERPPLKRDGALAFLNEGVEK